MGVTKTDLFTEKQNQMAVMAKAFGHPARIAIIEYLLKTNTCITNDFVSEFGLAQATISQHLKELKNLGIIKGNVEGTSMCYCINSEVWVEVQANFESLFAKFNAGKECC